MTTDQDPAALARSIVPAPGAWNEHHVSHTIDLARSVLALTEERDRMRGLLEEARARRLHVPDCAVEYGGRCDCDEQKLSNRIDAALRDKETP